MAVFDLNSLLGKLGLEEYKNVFFFESEILSSEFDDAPEILSEKFISFNANEAGLDSESIEKLLAVAKRISGDSSLNLLFQYSHFLIFKSVRRNERIGADFPDMESVMGSDGPAFLMLLAISGIPESREYFKKMKMPQDVADWAVRDLGLWCEHFKLNKGIVGLTPRILGWECELIRGGLYRLGRLQFNIRPFGGRLRVYRNRSSREVLALAEDGLRLNSDGQFDGVDDIFDEKGAWTSTLLLESGKVEGNPVSSLGYVKKDKLELDLSEWEEVLAPGDPVLDTHIPAGGSMTVEACAESFERAMEFFPEYFPEKEFKGWSCHSWFLDVQYEDMLPETPNIIKFQREYYLYPIAASGQESYWRVFGEEGMKDGIENAPRKSSMQRAVAEYIENGGRLRAGGAFFLKEDMPYGRQVYRKKALEQC
jgi:hypothetical protein